MKQAFTMIELIFVIVIIGILSAVAIPKLIANRDDATATICITTAQQFLQEVAIYYTVHGDISNISTMSNIRVNDADIGFKSDIDLGTSTAQFYCANEPLLQYVVISNSTVTLTVSSLSPSSPPAALIADTTLGTNSFYRTYVLGGYTN